ncbi:SDR family NAD(P)-dependent oxidoreductase [Xanthomonas oryzae pv. oryzae]|uniref:SDR family oxidoreductase n=1 Tax=Xanthomonas oryzae TaxID=347 RepID=UPI0008599A59|nr:SDR family oxidoreductase [Xanthomonas oryzae]AOS17239.1 oxidoreductase [Xanthomonas oryzae pv. oryzae]QBN88841.1 SDR family oxidoreductase [Xanthomonas oryzae pv. oryzae]RBA90868.1 SDR family NAD(P)-dependent oxidoreductase [Xanthomonas oryzae pv. oryzae]RBA97567.1 SDR family NAD(P)-dependent oxidoreductase [Xanthomonas oryzae pv. oryzae]RBB11006.1 SDR family NAD(P)-dependent oxidoreductase [Xanthomonas oryzae pv. oryzae]
MALTPAISTWTPSPLQGRVVVITGGAQGIGRGIAQAVLGAGGSVMIGDLDADAGRACLQEWALPRHSAFVRCDAAREAQAARLITTALKRFGRIDGLVNNAGVPDPHSAALSQLDWDEWNRRLSSLHGAFLCSKHALPALTQAPGGGAIVNIASTRAWQSAPHSEAYAAAKGGLVALTHALALSEGPQVRVNSISPGWISTDAWRAPQRRRAPKLSRRDHAQHPAGRVGTPEDIAQLAVYLLAPQLSGFVTGQDVIVDGGMSRKMQYV